MLEVSGNERRGLEHTSFPRVLAAISAIYVAQSVIGGLTFQSVPAIMRSSGADLQLIGLVSLTMLPWALKFLWAPTIERYRLPPGARRRSRRIVVVGQLAAAAALVAAALIGPTNAGALLLALGIAALAAATIDIACDAFAVEALSARDRGWGNTAQVGGSYLGMIIGGGVFLILYARLEWTVSVLSMAALLVVLTIPFALASEADAPVEPRAHRPSLRAAFARPQMRVGLIVAALFDVGLRLAQPILTPYLVDAKIDLETLGILRGVGGTAAAIAATFVGGAVVRICGAERGVILSLALQIVALSAIGVAAALGVTDPLVLVVLYLAEAAASAFGFVALYSLLMGYSSLTQAGIDFTLFQCADALIAIVAGVVAGTLASTLGYAVCFGLAAAASVVAIVLIPWCFAHLESQLATSSPTPAAVPRASS
jgi:MFS transporter, putative signal transducer